MQKDLRNWIKNELENMEKFMAIKKSDNLTGSLFDN